MKLAALDVGTNTVLMLVAECTNGCEVRPLKDLSRITRLGRGVEQSGYLDPDSANFTLATIKDFVSQARELGAQKFLTAATSALRQARDGAEFIAKVRAETGVTLEIISGETEAYLSYLASVRGFKLDPEYHLLIIDIGGGSTELIFARPGRPLALTSLELGSVRLTERIVKHDPPTAAENLELERTVDETLASLGWDFHPDLAIGIAGTVTTLASLALELDRYDHAAVHGLKLSRERVVELLGRLRTLNLEQRKALPGMVEGRADVIIAGVTILERILSHFGTEHLLVSDQGVRWGLIWHELDRLSPA